MSAITGICFIDGRPVNRADLEPMVESLAHRGPDGAGLWIEGPVGFGHRMLRTTPESLHERLPRVSSSGDLAINADARIDNRDELIAALGIKERPTEEISDSELILDAYERWGERCPERLVGDFAFVIWDGPKQVLFAARDQIGIRPFYYHLSDRAFVFGSEIKALLCLPEVPRRLNETKLADLLVPMDEDNTITFYRDIQRLAPGHCLAVSRGETRLWSYWALDPSAELRLGSDEEYAEAFREVFTEAVRCRLRSSVPVGASLSGGLDSSSVVCVAQELLAANGNGRVPTVSARWDDEPEVDEYSYMSAVVAQGGVDAHYVRCDRLSPLSDIDRVLWYQDEPFTAPNMYALWAINGTARDLGLRVMLDGLDGDIVVSHGLAHLAELARRGRWLALATAVRRLSRDFYNYNATPGRLLWHRAIKPLAPDPVRRIWRVLRRRNRLTWPFGIFGVISEDFALRTGLAERLQASLEEGMKPSRSAREDQFRHLTSPRVPSAMEVVGRATAAFSIEPRHPFFDKRLVEFCLSLPGDQKLHKGWTRSIMRRALADILPEAVSHRGGKGNLAPHYRRALLTHERERLEEVALNSQALNGYVDKAALRERYNDYISDQNLPNALLLWQMAVLALWLDRTGLTS